RYLTPSPRHPFPTRRSSDLQDRPQTPRDTFSPLLCALIQAWTCEITRMLIALLASILHCSLSVRTSYSSIDIPIDAICYPLQRIDRKSTRLNSSHVSISYAV